MRGKIETTGDVLLLSDILIMLCMTGHMDYCNEELKKDTWSTKIYILMFILFIITGAMGILMSSHGSNTCEGE